MDFVGAHVCSNLSILLQHHANTHAALCAVITDVYDHPSVKEASADSAWL
jgi:hypothetical protein